MTSDREPGKPIPSATEMNAAGPIAFGRWRAAGLFAGQPNAAAPLPHHRSARA